MNALYQWERDELKKLVSPVEIDKIDPFGMEEYLPSDIDGENESQTQSEVINFKPHLRQMVFIGIEQRRNASQAVSFLDNQGKDQCSWKPLSPSMEKPSL